MLSGRLHRALVFSDEDHTLDGLPDVLSGPFDDQEWRLKDFHPGVQCYRLDLQMGEAPRVGARTPHDNAIDFVLEDVGYVAPCLRGSCRTCG